ncbi:Protein kinase domain [Carpediemonas membranifera]|uniref:Protein kinase domain n=1 Tax=Carpediemonas membranifera TaxID=201153 RepID=A0A8J6ARN3_9EUKA|nr:Protein kinase domain [Carpediemonas membranifera]|eukprot:KAG9392581.1 Protein kinase domain [Carpediemonas membranifera]
MLASGMLTSAPRFGGSENAERFEKYEEQLLGHGAFKAVYKAFDHEEGIEVAWNQFRVNYLNESETLKLLGEIELLRSLKHPNIINFYDAWTTDDQNYIIFITEFMSSGTLRQYISRVKGVRLNVISKYCRQIISGLRYLHGHEPVIIHRDLKCDNIFINGNHGEVKIGDLGLSTYLRTSHAASVIGTPEFMAPEMYEEAYDEGVDIYSFGMCVLEMVTGEYPYVECENAIQVYKKVSQGIPPTSLALVSDETVRDFIQRCLRPRDTRPSVEELATHPLISGVQTAGSPAAAESGRVSPAAIESGHVSPTSDDHVEYLPDGTTMVCISLSIAGESHSVEFQYDETTDTPESVAQELLAEFELNETDTHLTVKDVADRIRTALQCREQTGRRSASCLPDVPHDRDRVYSLSLRRVTPQGHRSSTPTPTPSQPPSPVPVNASVDMGILAATMQTEGLTAPDQGEVQRRMKRLEARIMEGLTL